MPMIVVQDASTFTDASRTGTFSAMDFAWWTTLNAELNLEEASMTEGSDDNPTSVITWSASRVGLLLPSTFSELQAYCATTQIPVTTALKKRGCLLFSTTSVAVTLGFGDIVDYQFKKRIIRRVTNVAIEEWQYGATVTGLRY